MFLDGAGPAIAGGLDGAAAAGVKGGCGAQAATAKNKLERRARPFIFTPPLTCSSPLAEGAA